MFAGVGNEYVVETLVDSQRRVLMAIQNFDSQDSFLVARLTTDGHRDNTFGSNGLASIDLSSLPGATRTTSMALAPDGSIFVAGDDLGANNDMVVVKLTPNGDVDTDYTGGGIVVFDYEPGASSRVRKIAAAASDRLVVVGHMTVGSVEQGRITRLTSAGLIDSTFASGGVAKLPEDPSGISGYGPTETTQFLDVAVRPEGAFPLNETYAVAGYTDRSGGSAIVTAFDDGVGGTPAFNTGHPLGQVNLTSSSSNPLFAQSIALAGDGGFAVGLRGGAYADGGGVLRVDDVGDEVTGFGANGFSSLLEVNDLAYRGESLFIAGFGGGNLGYIGLLDDSDGSINTAFGTQVSPHITTFTLQGSHAQPPSLAVDGAGVPVVGWDDNGGPGRSYVRRFVGLQPPGPRSATKILFSEGGSLFAMSSTGDDVVTMSQPTSLETDSGPAAGFSGDFLFERRNLSLGSSRIYRADASDGANATSISDSFYPGADATEPSYAEDGYDAFVGFMTGDCMHRIHLGGSFSNPGSCGLSHGTLNPTDPGVYAAISNGDVVLGGFGGFPLMRLTDQATQYQQGPVETVERGLDGQRLVITFKYGAALENIAMSYLNPPEYNGVTTFVNMPVTQFYGSPLPHDISSYAVSPDLADPAVVIAINGTEIVKQSMGGGGSPTVLRTGTNLGVGQWTRQLLELPSLRQRDRAGVDSCFQGPGAVGFACRTGR